MVFRFPDRSAQSYAEQLGTGNLNIFTQLSFNAPIK